MTQIEKKVGQVVTMIIGNNGNGKDADLAQSNNSLISGLSANASDSINLPLPTYLSKQEQWEKLMELFTDRLTTANSKLADSATVLSHLFEDIKGLMDEGHRDMLDDEMRSLFAAQNEIRAIVAVVEELGFGK